VKERVVFGLLGTTLDRGFNKARWNRWRPTVDVVRHPSLPVHRFELLYPPKDSGLAERVAADIRQESPGTDVHLHAMEMADPWDFEEVYASLFEWARRYDFTPDTHEYLVNITTGTHVAQICWFLLSESRHVPATLLQVSPPPRDRKSEVGSYRLIDLDLSRYDRIARRFEREKLESIDFLKAGIDTRNPAFNALIARIEVVATRSKAPLLLMGPTGAGKSQLANRIFALKRERQRLEGAFVAVNCATLRGDGAMSALFGHVKGAYTGAVNARPGRLKSADRGVLFLDEIGELGLDEQAMLLRAIEERTFVPVGSDHPVSSDFQLLAGTNRDLWAQVAEGRFREDLLARINLWTFELPGLARRLEDLEPNLDYELEQWEAREGRRVTMNREARRRFLAFGTAPDAQWRGNFRDLNAAMMRMATLAPGGRIDVDTVDGEIERLRHSWRREGGGDDEALIESLLGREGLEALDPFDRPQLAEVIRVCRGARTLSEAGRILFAVSRTKKAKPNDADRLRKYLARHGLDWHAVTA